MVKRQVSQKHSLKRSRRQSLKRSSKQRKLIRRSNKTNKGGFSIFGNKKKNYVNTGLKYLTILRDKVNITKDEYKQHITNFINFINDLEIIYTVPEYKYESSIPDRYYNGDCNNLYELKYYYMKLILGENINTLNAIIADITHNNIIIHTPYIIETYKILKYIDNRRRVYTNDIEYKDYHVAFNDIYNGENCIISGDVDILDRRKVLVFIIKHRRILNADMSLDDDDIN
jgi:hypothetical protein